MNPATQCFALLAGGLHVLIFLMESMWFMRPEIHRKFGAATPAEAKAIRLFAFNQGFYNLFLATGVFAGIVLIHFGDNPTVAHTLVLFSCACMFSAAIVLVVSAGRRMLQGAVIQGLFPFLAWLCWFVF
jgi:putative membrane protein